METVSNIIKYREVKAKDKSFFQLVLDITPFYAESGGQVGDAGYIESEGVKYAVVESKKENDMQVLFLNNLPTNPEIAVTCVVDPEKRRLSANNHSATHLLHAALKQVLGSHVNQKGSLVNDSILRFDFSHFAKVTDEELKRIEDIVNTKIREAIPLNERRNVPIQEALKTGANALFGEKYGDFVRVITFDNQFSVELCGGTHVQNVAQIGVFKIIAESSVAAGVRRIEALTSDGADQYIENQFKLVEEIKELLKNPVDLKKSINLLLDENNKLGKQVEKFESIHLQSVKKELISSIVQNNGLNVIIAQVDVNGAEALKTLAYELRGQVENLFCVLGCIHEEKPFLAVMISDNLVTEKSLNATQIIRNIAKEIEGGGGGQPFFATAGGKKTEGLKSALEKAAI